MVSMILPTTRPGSVLALIMTQQLSLSKVFVDGGGSNGSRVRQWKVGLQRLADELNIPISVCHLPSGTSKWNKIEHRFFSFIP